MFDVPDIEFEEGVNYPHLIKKIRKGLAYSTARPQRQFNYLWTKNNLLYRGCIQCPRFKGQLTVTQPKRKSCVANSKTTA